jgi:hypothetical protein
MAQFTALDGDRRYKQIDWGPATLPPCQAPYIEAGVECDRAGEFDSPTIQGPWADLCAEHALRYAPPNQSLGFHRIKQEK